MALRFAITSAKVGVVGRCGGLVRNFLLRAGMALVQMVLKW